MFNSSIQLVHLQNSVPNHAMSYRLMLYTAANLARGDVQTERRWVVVLEELEAQSVGRADLNALGGTSSARSGSDGVAVARLDGDRAELTLLAWAGVPGGLLVGNLAQLREDELTGAGEGVGRSLKLRLLWEEEDSAALLARVRAWDVEVEDGALLRADGGVVLSTVGLVWLSGVDWDDEVRGLVGTSQSSWAGTLRWSWLGAGWLLALSWLSVLWWSTLSWLGVLRGRGLNDGALEGGGVVLGSLDDRWSRCGVSLDLSSLNSGWSRCWVRLNLGGLNDRSCWLALRLARWCGWLWGTAVGTLSTSAERDLHALVLAGCGSSV